MSDNKKEEPKNDKVDNELSELLDSALEDFKKEPAPGKEAPKGNAEDSQVQSEIPTDPNSLEWTNDFIQQAAQQFEANFANLLTGGDPNVELTPDMVQQKLAQMAEAAQQVLSNPTAPTTENSTDIASSITQAIQGLNEGAEGLQNPFSEEDLMKMFGNPDGGANDILPFMQGMMQGLLSKEVLAPSLQDFIERLPEYLEKNKDTIKPEDRERYLNQKKLMEEVLEELNKDQESDTAEEKKERFSKVLGLMQKLEEYGQPPSELVGDVQPPFQFDPSGMPSPAPGADQNCSIM